MKNKGYGYIIMVIISLIILAIINFFMFGFNSIDSKILNKNWYHYDYTTGYYELLIINKDKIEYKSNNSQIDLSDCNTYNYDKKKNLIEMNCGKNLEIRKIKSNSLETKIDIYDKVFFDNIEDSMNYEFKNYFGIYIVKTIVINHFFLKNNTKRMFFLLIVISFIIIIIFF